MLSDSGVLFGVFVIRRANQGIITPVMVIRVACFACVCVDIVVLPWCVVDSGCV